MDKKSFYDIDNVWDKETSSKVAEDINKESHNHSVSSTQRVEEAPLHKTIIQGEKEMADIVTGTVTGLVNNLPETTLKEISDARREQAQYAADARVEDSEHTADIRREMAQDTGWIQRDVAKAATDNLMATKDARFETITRVESNADRLQNVTQAGTDAIKDRLFTTARDTMDLRAQVTALGTQVRDNAQLSALQTEKAVLQNTIEGQKNTQYLSDKIAAENEKTRDLINDLKYHDLNRGLVERNTELVECVAERRHYRDRADHNQFQGQWAALQAQLQAFASQLQETRQGVTNFGTMTGNAGRQQSTSNNA